MRREIHREYIGERLHQKLIELLGDGRHIALLGPRNGGKSLVLSEIEREISELPRDTAPRIVNIPYEGMSRDGARTTIKTISALLKHKQKLAKSSLSLSGQFAMYFKNAVATSPVPLWFFVSDILGFPTPIARALLTAFQDCYSDENVRGRMAAIVSGSADFVPMTYSQVSPFHHAEQFIIYGMDPDTARAFFYRRRLSQLSIYSLTSTLPERSIEQLVTPDAFRYLYQQTGGQPHLIQEIVASATRHPLVINPKQLGGCWTMRQMKPLVGAFIHKGMAVDYFCRMALREVERDTNAHDALLRILKRRQSSISLLANYPGKLEVSGIAVRNSQGMAEISCPAWKSFLKKELTLQRIADEHACQHRWGMAWHEYKQLSKKQRERPVSGDARFRLRTLVAVWKDSLWNLVPQGAREVSKQFFEGAHHILGFDIGNVFETHEGKPIAVFNEVNCLKRLKMPQRVPHNISLHTRYLDGGNLWFWRDRFQLRAETLIGEDDLNARKLIIALIRKGEGREIDSAEQPEVSDAIGCFLQAYRAADNYQFRRSVGELRNRHLKVIERVNRLIASRNFNMGKVVKCTAEELVKTAGYMRVQICLVSPLRDRIQGVASAHARRTKDFTLPTDFPLQSSRQLARWDVQPWVVHERKMAVIADASDPKQLNPTCQVFQSRQLGMKGIAVVPMQIGSEVLGTLHFERKDRASAPRWEQNLFMILAGQIAAALEQARKLTLLEQSFQVLPNRLKIVGPTFERLMSNNSEAQEAGVASGWITSHGTAPPFNRVKSVKLPIGTSSLELNSIFRLYQKIRDSNGRERLYDFVRAPIDDFRAHLPRPFDGADPRIGYVERYHDLTDLYDVLSALQDWIGTRGVEETAKRILEYLKTKGFRWARLYLRNSLGGGEFLRSFDQFGLKLKENKEAFRLGAMTFSREDRDPLPWHALSEAREVVVYEWNSECPPYQVKPAPKLEGLPRYWVRTIQNRGRLERTRRDNRWIEAPLLFGTQMIGKISLAWSDSITSFDWELLRLAVFGMSVSLHHEIISKDSEHRRVEEAWQNAAAQVAHQLGNKLPPAASFIRYALKDYRRDPLEAVKSLQGAQTVLDECLEVLPAFKKYVSVAPLEDRKSTKLFILVRYLADEMRRRYPNSGIITVARSIPNVNVSVSMSAMIDVVENLLLDSIRHSGKRANKLKIGFAACRTASPGSIAPSTFRAFVRIEYKDNGKGIVREQKEHIFQPFHTTHHKGTGLGLSISRRLVRRQGGELTEEGLKGHGAKFCIYLPIVTSRRHNETTK
jgi:signal transduction histidine kinase/GAF domain-containing protein